MSVEDRRLCGFRKVGGSYMVGRGLTEPCRKMPLELCDCPTCGQGIKRARGYQWLNAKALAGGACADPPARCKDAEGNVTAATCPFMAGARGAGLLWVGKAFYTPGQFVEEAVAQGVSKRLHNPIRGIEMGKTWILLAHAEGAKRWDCERRKNGLCVKHLAADGSLQECPISDKAHRSNTSVNATTGAPLCMDRMPVQKKVQAIFYAFKPERYELLVTKAQFDALTPDEVEAYDARHIKLVVVPNEDRDHQGSVWDEESEA